MSNHHHYPFPDCFQHSKEKLCAHLIIPYSPLPPARLTFILFLSLWIFYVFFGLILLSLMFSGFISVVSCKRIPFLFKDEQYSRVCVAHISLMHSSVNEHLGCFYLFSHCEWCWYEHLWKRIWVPVLSSLGYMPRNGIAGSCGISMFIFFSQHQAIFHRRCTILQLNQQCVRIHISPHPCQPLAFSVFKKILVIIVEA